jgi:hypothetical protein
MFSISSTATRTTLSAIAIFILLLAAAPFGRAASQPNERLWQAIEESSLDSTAQRLIVPSIYRTVRLDTASLSQTLAAAPMEFTREAAGD